MVSIYRGRGDYDGDDRDLDLQGVLPPRTRQRRSQLQDAMHTQILPLFESRLLGFDADDALAFASIYAKAKLAGHAIDFADCAIAAITSMRRFMLATRNQKDFKGTGIQLINPWRPEQ